jgi:hypothetical protein
MKKLIALILLFFLLPLSSYANKNYAEVIICEIKHADGNYQSHVFYRRNDQFLWIKGEDEILINKTFEDDSFLFLNLAESNFSMNVGINKKSKKIKIDGMDVEESFSITRVIGDCRLL